MTTLFDKSVGTARMQAPTLPTPAPQARPLLKLSEAAAAFMEATRNRGLAARTIAEYRLAAWSVIEFIACDAPIRELACDTPARYVDWLRATPSSPRR